MKHLILAILAAAFSLSVTAATNLNSSKSNVADEATTTVKSSKSNSSEREQALRGADSCNFTIDEPGVKRQAHETQHQAQQQGAARQATEAQKQKCEADRKLKDAVVK